MQFKEEPARGEQGYGRTVVEGNKWEQVMSDMYEDTIVEPITLNFHLNKMRKREELEITLVYRLSQKEATEYSALWNPYSTSDFHIHTHTCTHVLSHTYMGTYTHVFTHTYMVTYTHVLTHTYMGTYTCAHTHTNTDTHMHITFIYICKNKNTTTLLTPKDKYGSKY